MRLLLRREDLVTVEMGVACSSSLTLLNSPCSGSSVALHACLSASLFHGEGGCYLCNDETNQQLHASLSTTPHFWEE